MLKQSWLKYNSCDPIKVICSSLINLFQWKQKSCATLMKRFSLLPKLWCCRGCFFLTENDRTRIDNELHFLVQMLIRPCHLRFNVWHVLYSILIIYSLLSSLRSLSLKCQYLFSWIQHNLLFLTWTKLRSLSADSAWIHMTLTPGIYTDNHPSCQLWFILE